MKLNNAAWVELKSRIETLLESDTNITDVSINYQVKQTKGEKNFAKFNIKLEQ